MDGKVYPRRSRLLFRSALILAAVILVSGLYWLWDHRHYWLTHNFRVVSPGKVYAGGYHYPDPLSRIVRKYGIRTVLCLRYSEGDWPDRVEQETLQRLGVRFIRVAIPFNRPLREQIAAVEECLKVLGNPSMQPVFVHCWGGQHRTGIVIGAYRARFEQADQATIWQEFDRYGGNTADPPYAQQLLRAFLRREERRRQRRVSHRPANSRAARTDEAGAPRAASADRPPAGVAR